MSLTHRQRLTSANHMYRQQHIVGCLGHLTSPRRTRVKNLLGASHSLKYRTCSRESALLPPHIKAKVPAAAAATPPDTGVSIKSIPSSAAASPTCRAVAASIVLASRINVSVDTLANNPVLPKKRAATCLPAGNILIMTSALAAASAADGATDAPSVARAAQAASTRSKTVSEWPAAIRFLAIGPPILPNPKSDCRHDLLR